MQNPGKQNEAEPDSIVMEAKKKIRFIINPKSGNRSKGNFEDRILKSVDSAQFEPEILFTQAPQHATQLSQEAAHQQYYAVIAVGGDGSVNETAAGLVNSKTALGILPAGSGNGMSKHLGIPDELENAIAILSTASPRWIDTAKVNDKFCIGTMGIGFDAHIAHLFSKSGKRGYSTYVKLILSEFYNYPSKEYRFTLDDKNMERKSFLLTFANSSQFGNNAVIAPFADETDGLLEVTSMKSFPAIAAPHLIWRMMHNSLHKSKFYEGFRAKKIVVENPGIMKAHIDGEPVEFSSKIKVEIVPSSLLVIAPERKKSI